MDIAGWVIILIVLLFILGFLIFLSVLVYDAVKTTEANISNGINNIESILSRNYQQYVNSVCQTTTIITPTQPFTRFTSPSYDEVNSSFLLIESINVTRANCINLNLTPPPGFDTATRIMGINPFGGQNTMFAYYFTSTAQDTHLIAFTGTWSFEEWEDDFDFPQVAPNQLNNYTSGVLVHNGWYQVYLSVRAQLIQLWTTQKGPNTQLVVTGHSLGGALSVVCAYDFALLANSGNFYHYSYAAPPVGNPQFSNQFVGLVPISWRIINSADIVPDLPPPLIAGYQFQQTSNTVVFNDNTGSYLNNHVAAYLNVIADMTPNSIPELIEAKLIPV